jgi:molybdate transport system substrate-binding protein
MAAGRGFGGDADIGFQQISELLPVKGIDYLGPLPADIFTVFAQSRCNAFGIDLPWSEARWGTHR